MLWQIFFTLIQVMLSFSEFWVFEDLPELHENLTKIHDHINKYDYQRLLETAVGYYDELKELTYAVDYKEHEADLMLRNIYDEGGPVHAYNPPYDKFTECYKWSEKERLGYEDLMNKTCKVWNKLKVKVKDHEDLEAESSGNF